MLEKRVKIQSVVENQLPDFLRTDNYKAGEWAKLIAESGANCSDYLFLTQKRFFEGSLLTSLAYFW